MNRYIIIMPVILMLALAFMSGCSDDTGNTSVSTDAAETGGEVQMNEAQVNEDGTISINLSGGADAFIGFEPEEIALEVVRENEIQHLDFIGVSLDVLLAGNGITDFTKIELVVSGMDNNAGNMDITEMAKADAGYFLAWSESGTPETPVCTFPKDAGIAELLTHNVTEMIITK